MRRLGHVPKAHFQCCSPRPRQQKSVDLNHHYGIPRVNPCFQLHVPTSNQSLAVIQGTLETQLNSVDSIARVAVRQTVFLARGPNNISGLPGSTTLIPQRPHTSGASIFGGRRKEPRK